MDIQKIHKEIQPLFSKARDIALEGFAKMQGVEVKKGKILGTSLVTETDKKLNEFFKIELQKSFPEIGFIGEESSVQDIKDYNWIVDPIDGTSTFYNGMDHWGISLALWHKNDPVYGVLIFPKMIDWYYYGIVGTGVFDLNDKRIEKKNDKGFTNYIACSTSDNTLIDRFKTFADNNNFKTYFHRVSIYDGKSVTIGNLDFVLYKEVAIWDAAGVIALARANNLEVRYIKPMPEYTSAEFADYNHSLIVGTEETVDKYFDSVKEIL